MNKYVAEVALYLGLLYPAYPVMPPALERAKDAVGWLASLRVRALGRALGVYSDKDIGGDFWHAYRLMYYRARTRGFWD